MSSSPDQSDVKSTLKPLTGFHPVTSRISGQNVFQATTADYDEEIHHLQADGFFGLEKGFDDAEQLRRK
jgi:hypothetical protein